MEHHTSTTQSKPYLAADDYQYNDVTPSSDTAYHGYQSHGQQQQQPGYQDRDSYFQERDSRYSSNASPQPLKSPPRPHRAPHYYVPAVLRLPFLFLVFLITLALLGLIELGVHRLPHAQKSAHIDPRKAIASAVGIHKRWPQVVTNSSPAAQTTDTIPAPAPVATSSAAKDSYVSTDPPKTGTTVVPTIIVGTTMNTGTGGYVDTKKPSTAAFTTGEYVPTTVPVPGPGSSSTSGAYVETGRQTVGAVPKESFVPTTVAVLVPTTQVTSVPSVVVSTNAQGQVISRTTFVPTTSVGTTIVSTALADGQTSPGKGNVWGGGGGTTAVGEEQQKNPFPLWTVFVGNSYFLLIVVVLFKQFWNAIYQQAKLIEPFSRLNTEGGASANSVLSTFYLSSSIVPDPVLALIKGHWFVLWNGIVFFAVGLLAPVGSELLFLSTRYDDCPVLNANDPINPCWPPRLSIDPVIARVLEGLLTYIAIMTLSIMFMMYKMRTGVYADPSSIAAIAALTHHPEVLDDFRALTDEASSKDLRLAFADKKYKLDQYMRADGVWRYGIVPAVPNAGAGFQAYHSVPHSEDRKEKELPQSYEKPNRFRKWKMIDLTYDVLFLLVLLALLGIVVAYYKDGNDDAFNRFFNSMAFGPRFVLTGTGTLIAVNWRRLERDAHTLSPYYRMAQAPSSPLTTVLLRKSSIPLTAIFPMLFQRHFMCSFIALIATISELLVIFLGAVPFAPGQIYLELLVSCYISMALLGGMVLALLALMVWKRRMPDMPRAPDTVAGVASYVADSKMLEDFEGAEWCDDNELKGRIGGLGKRYGYGKRAGSDGRSRYLVDEEDQNVYHS